MVRKLVALLAALGDQQGLQGMDLIVVPAAVFIGHQVDISLLNGAADQPVHDVFVRELGCPVDDAVEGVLFGPGWGE
jgi:hypothetical protein